MCNNYEYALCKVMREFSEPSSIEEVISRFSPGEVALLKMYLDRSPVQAFMQGLIEYGYLEEENSSSIYHITPKGLSTLDTYGKCLEIA